MTNLLIDMSGMLYATFYAHSKQESTDIVLAMCYYSAFNKLLSLYNQHPCHRMVLVFDSSNWRKQYTADLTKCVTNAHYKGNRRKSLTEAEKKKVALFDEHVNELYCMLKEHTSLSVMRGDGLEADDIIAGFTQIFTDDTNIIVSGDNDFLQLIRDKNVLIDLKTGKPKSLLDWNNDPEYFMFEKCIRGDDGDNVMSAYPRIRRTAILEAYNDEFKRQNIMQHRFKAPVMSDAGEVSEVEYCTKEVFAENQILMDLRMQPKHIRKKIMLTVDDCLENTGKYHHIKFMRFCKKYELISILDRIDAYVPMFAGKPSIK